MTKTYLIRFMAFFLAVQVTSAIATAVVDPPTTSVTGTYIQQVGSLKVTISPKEVIRAGATWRRVGTTKWRKSSGTERSIPVGSYTVEFKDVKGWNSSAKQNATIKNGETTSVTGTYTQQVGSLKVTINPQGTIDAGAKWQRVGTTTWRDSNYTESDIPVGSYAVEFKDVNGWTTPAKQSVTISNNKTTSASGTYKQQNGNLKVTLRPTAAVLAGAKWGVDGGAWRNSGVTVTGLPVGSHTVNYKSIAGWVEPASKSVTIKNDRTTNVSGIYKRGVGNLKVTLGPTAAVSAGAQWRVDGGAWRNSGVTVTGLPVGSHTVNYKSIDGWSAPADQSVTVYKGQTTGSSGTYTQQTGSLQVTISPTGAISAGAQWRRVGTTMWHNSGDTESGISAGSYTVEFKDIAGCDWDTPASQSVDINKGQTTSASGTYTRQNVKPIISLSANQFVFEECSPPSATLIVSNAGTSCSTLNYTITSDSSWLTVSPTNGILPGGSYLSRSHSITVDDSNLNVGTYTATLTVSDPNSSNQTEGVTITFNRPPAEMVFDLDCNECNGSSVEAYACVSYRGSEADVQDHWDDDKNGIETAVISGDGFSIGTLATLSTQTDNNFISVNGSSEGWVTISKELTTEADALTVMVNEGLSINFLVTCSSGVRISGTLSHNDPNEWNSLCVLQSYPLPLVCWGDVFEANDYGQLTKTVLFTGVLDPGQYCFMVGVTGVETRNDDNWFYTIYPSMSFHHWGNFDINLELTPLP